MNNIVSFLDKLKYSIYIMYHPFKGFWDLKHSNIGKRSVATVLIALMTFVVVLKCQLTGFILNKNNILDVNLFYVVLSVILPFFIWVVANWGITTLVEGEGSLHDIYVTTAYAIAPYIIISFFLVIISNFIVLEEASLFYLLDTIAIIWTVLLLIIGLMSIHQFSMGKTIITMLIAIVGMIVIIFICLLFFALIQQMINFIILIIYEVTQ